MFSGDQRELVGIIVDLANSHTDTPRSWPPDANIKMLEQLVLSHVFDIPRPISVYLVGICLRQTNNISLCNYALLPKTYLFIPSLELYLPITLKTEEEAVKRTCWRYIIM